MYKCSNMHTNRDNILLSVFTPTYNRAHLLNRGYTALLNQTYKNFEWIIVDDGSTDNTREVVDHFVKEGNFFDIRYYYQENAGKHGAFNNVLPKAKGMFLLIIDSDDALRHNALEILVKAWNEIPDAKKEHFIGVSGLCEDQYGKLIGDSFPCSPFDSNSLEKYYKFKIKGDKSGMMKVEILRKFRYPDKKASYYPEAYLWFTIARQFQTRYINNVILTYFLEAKDSLSKPLAMPKNNAEAISDYYLYLINNFIGYFRYSPKEFLKYFVVYASYASYAGRGFTHIIKYINSPVSKFLGALLYPVSIYHRNKKFN
jgi:glycosyltransferase involved in cell wall biosynthesis